jgi:hypothetical protein
MTTLILLALACGMDQELVKGQPRNGAPASHPSDSDEMFDTGDGWEESDSPQNEDETDEGDSGDSDPYEGDDDDPDEGIPQSPQLGDVVINEMMIDALNVSDAEGEWVEIANATEGWLDLSDHYLGDDDVDEALIEQVRDGSLEIPPGGFAVICANSHPVTNGGVDCDGNVHYETWGGGFALSNGGDEVVLMDSDGRVLDAVRYDENDVPVGASLGLSPDGTDAANNDNMSLWCAQESPMNGGDAGTPGENNDDC